MIWIIYLAGFRYSSRLLFDVLSRSSSETEEQENRDQVQIELDTAEEFVINSLFPNGIKVNSFVKNLSNNERSVRSGAY